MIKLLRDARQCPLDLPVCSLGAELDNARIDEGRLPAAIIALLALLIARDDAERARLDRSSLWVVEEGVLFPLHHASIAVKSVQIEHVIQRAYEGQLRSLCARNVPVVRRPPTVQPAEQLRHDERAICCLGDRQQRTNRFQLLVDQLEMWHRGFQIERVPFDALCGAQKPIRYPMLGRDVSHRVPEVLVRVVPEQPFPEPVPLSGRAAVLKCGVDDIWVDAQSARHVLDEVCVPAAEHAHRQDAHAQGPVVHLE
mmetsp:Transcript_13105/g.37810  ORF Transcript_13105/g.37810 Transcript_13105/m.37810 type:complete len:254 (-) Transcript_13105:1270-2031(-)